MTKCDRCGHILEIGDFPFCDGAGNGHGPVLPHHPFRPYFDISLGRHITSNYQRNRIARSLKADMRDQPTKGDLSARLDRRHEMRRLTRARSA